MLAAAGAATMMRMRILVIGAGATGGFYGGRLALAGRDVTFLVRERRAAQLHQTGLVLQTPGGEQRLEPKLVLAGELSGAAPFDLILLGTKAYTLEAAMEDFAPAVGERTMILPLLNGMRHMDLLDARFGAERVLGGLCRIVSFLDREGRIVQTTALNELAYGERSRERTPRIEAVDAVLRGAQFDATLSPDIIAFMWVKWIMISSTGSINTLGHGTIGEIESVRVLEGAGARMQNRVLDEAIAIATACGYAPSGDAEAMVRRRLTEPGSGFESSMYRDMTRGLPVEADHILGDLLERGRRKGVDTPLLEAAYVQLRLYAQEREARR